MLIDDRLGTVLRSSATDDAAARTQFRQLIDLIGTLYPGLAHAPYEAHKRLDELINALPTSVQASILAEPGVRLRNARMIDQLAHADPVIAEAALNAACLDSEQWTTLIRGLPPEARAMLRHRKDLGPKAAQLLRSLGVSSSGDAIHVGSAASLRHMDQPSPDQIAVDEARLDQPSQEHSSSTPPSQQSRSSTGAFAWPEKEPESASDAHAAADPFDLLRRGAAGGPDTIMIAEGAQADASDQVSDALPSDAVGSIADLLQRMERMRTSRGLLEKAIAPPALFTKAAHTDANPAQSAPQFTLPPIVEITTDSSGTIIDASDDVAVLLVGMTIATNSVGAVAWLDDAGGTALQQQAPIRGAILTIDAAPAISGSWFMRAAPLFNRASGSFTGFSGHIQRANLPRTGSTTSVDLRQSDAMRQILHELRTPVNAIQGFAEVIQQQVFGPVSNDYRALAAAVAMDSARLMAGFDEIERFAKLQSNALDVTPGTADMSAVLHSTVQRITGALRPHSSRIALIQTGRNFTVPLAPEELEQLLWRIVATLGGNLQPGEVISLALHQDGPLLRLIAELPQLLRGEDDVFKATTAPQGKPAQRAISAGMFGSGYSLRLARAEAKAAGASLVHKQDHLELAFPSMPQGANAHNSGSQAMGSAAG